MTTSRYPQGCATGSQVIGDAAAWSAASAWNVNFNNGNVNNNHRDNNGFALAVRRPGEFQGADSVTFQSLYKAWRRARRQKVPSANQLRFDQQWMGNLLKIERDIINGTWQPRRSTCFIAARPKAREIHAPDFADRVVHHWLVPQLEEIYEPAFIFDSYANRKGKGSHAAVRCAQSFVRQVASGQGGGYYLQLDIANFFNSIHRPTLWALLKRRLSRAGLSQQAMQVTHALLRREPLHAGVDVRATGDELALVPPHKRLCNAAPGFGLPIGNLSSQFFANVMLDPLDQFAKHDLHATRYARYVDDFVLIHDDRDVLASWLPRIETFLRDQLRLELKADIRLRPLTDGLDFLGYVIRPTHTVPRRRVIAHANERLADWEGRHVAGARIRAKPADLRAVSASWQSVLGHLKHASASRLQARLHRRYGWLATATTHRRFAVGAERVTVNFGFNNRSVSV